MSRVTAAGGAGKERQKRSTNAAVMRATSVREGAFSRRLMVGCEQRSRPLSGAFPTASLNTASARSASQSSASSPGTGFAAPRTGSAAGDRQHTEAQHGGEGVDDQRLVAPIANTACQRVGQAQTALRLALTLDRPVCDCVYLALAHRIGARLVTADARFANALQPTEHGGAVVTLADYGDGGP